MRKGDADADAGPCLASFENLYLRTEPDVFRKGGRDVHDTDNADNLLSRFP